MKSATIEKLLTPSFYAVLLMFSPRSGSWDFSPKSLPLPTGVSTHSTASGLPARITLVTWPTMEVMVWI